MYFVLQAYFLDISVLLIVLQRMVERKGVDGKASETQGQNMDDRQGYRKGEGKKGEP